MATEIVDYVHVSDRASQLGCLVPAGIAILPENFEGVASRGELLFGSEAATIRKLFRNNNFPVDHLLPAGERVAAIHNKHFEWAPLIFISAALISENPNAVSVALGIVSNATDFFKGMTSKKVKLSIVVEKKKNGNCKKMTYEGDIEGIRLLADSIRKMSNE